jgi:hypothetical protein
MMSIDNSTYENAMEKPCYIGHMLDAIATIDEIEGIGMEIVFECVGDLETNTGVFCLVGTLESNR